LSLTPTGVAVNLTINNGAPKIPADLNAAVANRSAVGEQYVDLRPTTDTGPFLQVDFRTLERPARTGLRGGEGVEQIVQGFA